MPKLHGKYLLRSEVHSVEVDAGSVACSRSSGTRGRRRIPNGRCATRRPGGKANGPKTRRAHSLFRRSQSGSNGNIAALRPIFTSNPGFRFHSALSRNCPCTATARGGARSTGFARSPRAWRTSRESSFHALTDQNRAGGSWSAPASDDHCSQGLSYCRGRMASATAPVSCRGKGEWSKI